MSRLKTFRFAFGLVLVVAGCRCGAESTGGTTFRSAPCPCDCGGTGVHLCAEDGTRCGRCDCSRACIDAGVLPSDAGLSDGGTTDGGTLDAGSETPRIEVNPNDVLVIPGLSPSQAQLTVRNIGTANLRLARLTITGLAGNPSHPSVDDFAIQGCVANPCDLQISFCVPGAPGCFDDSGTFTILYENNNLSVTDVVELHIFSNDPLQPEYTLELNASDTPCFFPIPVIDVITATVAVGATILVDGSASLAGTGTVTTYEWQWVLAPPPPPALTPPNGAQTSFVPSNRGVHIISLDVTNDCGSMSQTSAVETIVVN